MLLWPHANVRYQKETVRLALAELRLMLSRVQPGAICERDEEICMPALKISVSEELSETALRAVGSHSLLYGLMRVDAGRLIPVLGRNAAYLGEDLPGILKYKGKTNEMFTAMTLNLALYAGEFWPAAQQRLHLLDPMCGKGTALFVGANRGYDCWGSDLNKKELAEAEHFFKRYLEYHRLKHKMRRESMTLGGGKSAPCVCFQFADTQQHFDAADVSSLRLAQADAGDVRRVFGKERFHILICDLPYGVQHAPKGGGMEKVLEKSLPQWVESLKHGGACAISFNAATLDKRVLCRAMEQAGFDLMHGDVYDNLEHWVEQAVTRDVVVGVRR